MIRKEDIRHCRTAIAVSNRSATQLYGRLVGGEQPEEDMEDILRHVDRLRSDLKPLLTLRMLWGLMTAVERKRIERRAVAEREGASHWSWAAVHCYVALGLLALRVVTHVRVVSLLHLQPILRYLHS